MIPGNVDPRRPDKVQRYKAPQTNGNAQAEDLTPDYMNILGPEPAANADPDGKEPPEEPPSSSSSATSVIPTSPQYGVAITPYALDVPAETTTPSTDTVTETTAKSTEGDAKDMHSTPSRNDRFKVVKIASLEPFKRGRWKCMDYVDETPPNLQKSAQSQGSTQVGAIYLQTQSLPQPHIQQMLMQGGYSNPPQFFAAQNVQTGQGIPHTQYFYAMPQGTQMQAQAQAQAQTLPQQIINPAGVPQGAIQPQFINTSQAYFPAGVVPNTAVFTLNNMHYVPSTIIPNQGSAFVPTTVQNVLPANFQQSQTYAGPTTTTSVPQANMVNGHSYSEQQQQVIAASLPTQAAKNVILQSAQSASANVPQQNHAMTVQSAPQSQTVSIHQNVTPTLFPQQQQQQQQQHGNNANTTPTNASVPAQSLPASATTTVHNPQPQTFDGTIPANIYANPSFVASVNNSAPNIPDDAVAPDSETLPDGESPSGDDSKGPTVVNAIDNKIEQAMDLVKSHLMYTVREEVEVLKEKIAELMERITQLETENNFLRSQLPKPLPQNGHANGAPEPPAQ